MTDLLQGFLSGSAAWGVLLTLAAFALGALINKTTGKAIFNPLLLGSIFVIILLSVLNIPYALWLWPSHWTSLGSSTPPSCRSPSPRPSAWTSPLSWAASRP